MQLWSLTREKQDELLKNREKVGRSCVLSSTHSCIENMHPVWWTELCFTCISFCRCYNSCMQSWWTLCCAISLIHALSLSACATAWPPFPSLFVLLILLCWFLFFFFPSSVIIFEEEEEDRGTPLGTLIWLLEGFSARSMNINYVKYYVCSCRRVGPGVR